MFEVLNCYREICCYRTRAVTVNNCGAKEAGTAVATGIDGGIDVRIYPNPATSLVSIDAPVKVNVQVYSADGKLILDRQGAHELDLNGLASGLYLVVVYDEHNNLLKRKRVVKE